MWLSGGLWSRDSNPAHGAPRDVAEKTPTLLLAIAESKPPALRRESNGADPFTGPFRARHGLVDPGYLARVQLRAQQAVLANRPEQPPFGDAGGFQRRLDVRMDDLERPGGRDVEHPRIRECVLQPQPSAALPGRRDVASCALGTGGIRHDVSLVEDDHAGERVTGFLIQSTGEPTYDLL